MRYGARDPRLPQFFVSADAHPGQPARASERVAMASHDLPSKRKLELVEARGSWILMPQPPEVERLHTLRPAGLHLVPIQIAIEIHAHRRMLANFEAPVGGEESAGPPAVRIADVDVSAERTAVEVDDANIGGNQVAAQAARGHAREAVFRARKPVVE